jgi:hypothetical protein
MIFWNFTDTTLPWVLFSLLFNGLLVVLILRLRLQSEGNPLTQSQRWGLTLLGYLYLSNSLQIAMVALGIFAAASNDYISLNYINRFSEDFNQVASMFLLLFGLVYPRPVARWDRLRPILVLIAIFWLVVIVVQGGVTVHQYLPLFGIHLRLIEPLYYIAVFIPIFLWLPQYERQNSPEMRMILTLMIWGYLLFFSGTEPANLIYSINTYHATGDLNIWLIVLISITFIYLGRTLYLRLGRWTSAEKVNLFFMLASGIFIIGNYGLKIVFASTADPMKDPVLPQLEFLLNTGIWMVIRPILFFYGLLRYQFFGPSVKADQTFVTVLGVLISGAAFLALLFGLSSVSWGLGAVAGAVVAVLLFFILRGRLGPLVGRLLPMSGGGRSVSLAERRTTYMVGLQSAVVAGEVSDPSDVDALRRLRKDLRVSDREHELLMSGFSKEKPPTEKQEVEEVYLFHKDGALLGYVVRQDKGAPDGKKDMMVTMFTAVREFSKDALKKGGEHLGAIDYGSTVLIIELEGDIALGVVLRGRDNPQVRQQMRDLLRKVHEDYSDAIKSTVKGDIKDIGKAKERLRGLEALLRGFLKG